MGDKLRIFIIGYGQAGGRIADVFVEHAKKTRQNFVANTLIINTALADLMGVKNIPFEDRILIGELPL